MKLTLRDTAVKGALGHLLASRCHAAIVTIWTAPHMRNCTRGLPRMRSKRRSKVIGRRKDASGILSRRHRYNLHLNETSSVSQLRSLRSLRWIIPLKYPCQGCHLVERLLKTIPIPVWTPDFFHVHSHSVYSTWDGVGPVLSFVHGAETNPSPVFQLRTGVFHGATV